MIHQSRQSIRESCTSSCSASCLVCINGTCQPSNNNCYIGNECYTVNQTRFNETQSCLQCHPEISTHQWSFNPQCSADGRCFNKTFLNMTTCDENITASFYQNHENAVVNLYNFYECAKDRKQCQAGFFFAKNESKSFACCAGFFCPEGQLCMIPCRSGSFCPSPINAIDGTCQSSVQCPAYPPKSFEEHGCGGSTFEGFCPAGSFCNSPTEAKSCPNDTKYCPTGVQQPLDCPTHFVCQNGRARRQRLLTNVVIAFIVIILIYAIATMIFQWLVLSKNLFGQHSLENDRNVSNYFKKDPHSKSEKSTFELNIYLKQAKLRKVTRFDPKRNEGFTGRIVAGRLTALMGGSGCGKSSLLETIHGRRQLRSNGYITFGEYEPLDNILTDYVGYVPQADIMHNDLTVFETVYYSARARRLNETKETLKNDTCFVLKSLGLANMHNSMTKTLSGGQRKRVNVAIEIVACPKVLLLDEPTSGLDTVSCDHLFDLLEIIKHSAAGPVTIIMVIHQPSQELFTKIDDIFFLTPHCCLAYQGPRHLAREALTKKLFPKRADMPRARHNDCDTCFIMLTQAPEFIENHKVESQKRSQILTTHSWQKRVTLPFLYVMSRSFRQMYVRGAIAEAAYMVAYFLLGTCIGYLFENKQQGTCDITVLPTIYFLMSLSFGILTCISSQRLFGVEITDNTFERESRNYFHPFQYWLAKTIADVFRMVIYPLLFLSMLYIEVVPRGPFSFYLGVMVLLSFVCSSIGQLTSVIFSRTEYAYLAGTIVALLSCLLSGFSPTKEDLGRGGFIVIFSFSRHVQRLLFLHETEHYTKSLDNNATNHIWWTQVKGIENKFSFDNKENPRFWLIFIGFVLRAITLLFLYGKSEYRSKARFRVTHFVPALKALLRCTPCRR